ncbi:MAG TPA: orotidine-5'-phosphate decarboxylase [Chloroflexi bacterium]|nr:orotidine-5'-phosphate decarboxylase [Chloroflexota bacterium]
MKTFAEKLSAAQQSNDSWLCIGLDPVMDRLPSPLRDDDGVGWASVLTFARSIVEATSDLVCAYKPNLAFWLAGGSAGIAALEQLLPRIPKHVPIILDAKSNDVGHTAAAYAHAAFDTLDVDGVTINPYLGVDTLKPFLSDPSRGVFLLTRTSNPSAPDLQDQKVDGAPLYEKVARLAAQWDADMPGTCGLVVGATYPEELARLRRLAPKLPFLIPGIGAQGGDLEIAVSHGPTAEGIGPVINSSRGIIYASSGDDFAEAAREAASTLRARINSAHQ